MISSFLKPNMTLVNDQQSFRDCINWLTSIDRCVFDIETTGLDLRGVDSLMGVGVGDEGRQFYLSFGHHDSALTPENKEEFRRALSHPTQLVAHNLKFDITGLQAAELIDITFSLDKQTWNDLLVYARLVVFDKLPSLDLRSLVARFISGDCNRYDSYFHTELIKKKYKGKFSKASTEETGIYCMNDVLCEAKLFSIFEGLLTKRGMESILKTETEVSKILWKMEDIGIAIDTDKCNEQIAIINVKLKDIQDKINKFLPAVQLKYPDFKNEVLNPLSSHDLRKIFATLGVQSAIQTKTGDSWNENALLLVKHPVADDIRFYRSLNKMKSTYLENYLLTKVDNKTSVLRSEFKNWGTVTGRLSAKLVQTFPRAMLSLDSTDRKTDALSLLKSKAGKKELDGITAEDINQNYMSWLVYEDKYDESKHLSVKRPIIARPGFDLVGFDFSQMELRVFFRYVNTPTIMKYLSDPTWEGHGWVAGQIWGVKKGDEKFPYYRQLSKAVSFGLIYGEGLTTLAGQMDTTVEEAKKFKNLYFERLPGAREFISNVTTVLIKRGYVKNLFGRQYSVSPDMSYVLVNFLIQGSCADFVKNRMVALDTLFKKVGTKTRLILQVHDEVVFEVDQTRRDIDIELIKATLEENILGISLPVEATLHCPSYANKIRYEKGVS